MDTDMKPTPISGSDTVHELISQLRSSFSFIELEKLIAQHERNLNQKLTGLQTKIEQVVKEKDLLFTENEKKQKKIDALTTANMAYKDQAVKILNADKVRVLENELKIKEKELKTKENEIRVLKKKNGDCEKKVKVYKKRFSDLDERVLLLEETAKEELKGFSIDYENIKQQKRCASESSRPPLSTKKEDSNKKAAPELEDIIKLDDDDDDDDRCIWRAKRKWVSESSDDDEFISTLTTNKVSKETDRGCNGDKISVEAQKMKKLEELNNQPMTCHPVSTPPSAGIGPTNLLSYFNIPDSRSCQDIRKVNEGNKSRWECEEDMLKEFEKDDELCLDAICALHRQRIHVNVYDVSRVANLAKLLIDGDPEKKLKKKASELKQFDLEHCRMFAKEYSSKLFKIYQQKDDPFFPSASSKNDRSED